jgi:alpha-mannosidase
MIYEDLPLNYDAWDAEIYHLKCGSVIRFDKVSKGKEGNLQASLIAEASFGKSKAVLEISLDAVPAGSTTQPIVRVKAKVDWHEKHKFLKCTPYSDHSHGRPIADAE